MSRRSVFVISMMLLSACGRSENKDKAGDQSNKGNHDSSSSEVETADRKRENSKIPSNSNKNNTPSDGKPAVTVDTEMTKGPIMTDEEISEPTVEAPLRCPESYIRVPANPEVGTSEDFCVMKFEAKLVGLEDGTSVEPKNSNLYNPESRETGSPWVNISRDNAIAACQRAGGDLISNSQWQTLARNIESVEENWTFAAGPSSYGVLKSGHRTVRPVAATEDSIGRPIDPDTIEARTHSLSNGETIWDLAGNASEWIKDTVNERAGTHDYVANAPWNGDAEGQLKWGPKNHYRFGGWWDSWGLGRSWLVGIGTVVRGGSGLSEMDSNGVFTANIGLIDDYRWDNGFRCVKPFDRSR